MEIAFYILLFLFVAAEVFTIIRYVKKKESKCVKFTAVPAGFFLAYLLALCIFRISIPYLVLTLAAITVFLHTVMGLYLDMYHRVKYFDRCLHAFGSFSFALLIYLTLSSITAPGGSMLFRAVFIAALGIAAGAVFEIIEFLNDQKNKTKMQRGLKDTDFDIIFDVVGSVAAAILAALVYL